MEQKVYAQIRHVQSLVSSGPIKRSFLVPSHNNDQTTLSQSFMHHLPSNSPRHEPELNQEKEEAKKDMLA